MEESDNEVVITLEYPSGKYRGHSEWQSKAELAIDVVRAIMEGQRGFVTVTSTYVDQED